LTFERRRRMTTMRIKIEEWKKNARSRNASSKRTEKREDEEDDEEEDEEEEK